MASFSGIDELRKVPGLSAAATLKEVKRAYRTLAHRHHPDKKSSAAWVLLEERKNKIKVIFRPMPVQS